MRISDWSSDVCSSDLRDRQHHQHGQRLVATEASEREVEVVGEHGSLLLVVWSRRRCVCRTCRLVKIRTTFVGEQFVGAAMAAIAPTCRGHGRSHGGYRVRSIALLPPATPWLHAAPARTPRPGPAATARWRRPAGRTPAGARVRTAASGPG